MKEIKFRVWDEDHGEMIMCGDEMENLSVTIFYDGSYRINKTNHSDKDGRGYYKLDEDAELMQYTGLHDKKGHEIYEGDIVKIGNKKRGDSTDIAEICFYRGGFMLHLKGYFGYRDIERNDGDCKKHEVIGNIYENPELIKEDAP